MCSKVLLLFFISLMSLRRVSSNLEVHQHEPQLMMSRSHVDERHHIEQHLEGTMNVNAMAEDELRFLYFKMHDSDSNNKLDGCELIKSLLHWHNEGDDAVGPEHEHHETTKIFGHEELSLMIDPILSTDDLNLDGFIDYPEFVAAQKSRGF